MTADLSELHRLLQNLIRFGTIAEVSGDVARVRLGPELVTTWLKWATLRAGNARTWWAPSVGEQIIVLSPGGDLTRGKILPAIYSEEFAAPTLDHDIHTTEYQDGAVISYDSAAHTLTATLPPGSSATIKADKVTSDATDTYCTGNLNVGENLVVQGKTTVNGGTELNGGVNAKAGTGGGPAMQVQGVIKATEDVIAGNISLTKHPHADVLRGGEQSGGPLP